MDINHVAKLANLPLTEKEKNKLTGQLKETIKYIQSLKKIDTKNVKPTSQVTGKINEFREDEIKPGLTREQALQNGPVVQKDFFIGKVAWK